MSSHVPDGRVERHEYVHIRRCDLRSTFMLNPAQRTYLVAPLQSGIGVVDRLLLSMGRPRREVPGAPTLVVETATLDTGERRSAFGYRARHVITTRRQFVEGNSKAAAETVTDGWYIDLDSRPACEHDSTAMRPRGVLLAIASPVERSTSERRVTFRDSGKREEGFALETRERSRWTADDARGREPALETHTLVTELSQQQLDPSLFEVPAGFRATEGILSSIASRFSRTAHVIQSVVASWLR